MKITRYYLSPIGTRQKSFYGKAYVEIHDGTKTLYSYNTRIAEYTNGIFKRIWHGFSATTLRHVNAFRLENGLDTLSKSEWCAL